MDKNNFSQKLAELTALAAASENKLQMTQVLDAFAKEQVTPEEMEAVYAKLEKKGIQILTEEEEGATDDSLLLDDADDNDESVSSIIGDKYRWSHNDSLDDGDNDDFTPSSAEEEEETTATSEQLLEGVASTDPIREYLKAFKYSRMGSVLATPSNSCSEVAVVSSSSSAEEGVKSSLSPSSKESLWLHLYLSPMILETDSSLSSASSKRRLSSVAPSSSSVSIWIPFFSSLA